LTAIELNPDNGHVDLAALYEHMGLHDLSARELQRASDVDPSSKSIKGVSLVLPWIRGDADAYLNALHKASDGSEHPQAWYYLRKGRLEEANKAIEEGLVNDPNSPELLMQQQLLFALKAQAPSEVAKVPEIINSADLNDPNWHHIAYDGACVYALSGNGHEAVKWLREAASRGFPNYLRFRGDPYLDRIRESPEFIQFLSEQKAQWDHFQTEFPD